MNRNRSEHPDPSKRIAPTYQPGDSAPDQNSRAPSATDWRATDFASRELRAWDKNDRPPFELPPSRDTWDNVPQQRRQPRAASHTRRLEDDYDAGWEAGTWDTRWSHSVEYRDNASRAQQYDLAADLRNGAYEDYDYADYDALEYSLDTLARLGAVGESVGRMARVRLLVQRRPAAAALLALFLLGFMLTCFAPLIPILRLGYDAVDISRRVTTLRGIVTDSSALFNATKLKEAQGEIDGITRDLYEINGAMNVAGAPLAAVNPEMRNYRLLVRIGYDVAASADEGINVVQTLLAPLQGGALSAGNSPGITTGDMQQANAVLADARTRMQDALAAYNSLDLQHMPAQLQPGSTYGKLLGLLPTANSALQELSSMINFMPQLLGVGQPAAYLVVAMDRTELRAGGGFTGNFGYLVLDGGKESKTYPLSLHDVYQLDQDYYQKNTTDPAACQSTGPQPPLVYWWWPYRDLSCTLGWGLRDSNLSPNFPTNAAMALQIAQASGNVPTNVQTQGMIAITPTVIEELLQAIAPNGLYLKDYNRTVTAQNLEHTIHEFQLGAKQPQDQQRKEFTHVLSSVMLDRIKSLHGAALKPVLSVLEKAIKEKDVQIYFSNPQAELVLKQLGLASSVYHGSGDGFFVVDTNDGGNKANQYVTEQQTDVVTLLPDGGALHHLQVAVTYDKKGSVYEGTTNFEDYLDMQRTYLPGNATILGYSGFTPDVFSFQQCNDNPYASAITDCVSPVHAIKGVTTESDVAGRAMVMGSVLVQCGPNQNYQSDFDTCRTNPTAQTVNVYIEWYTPNAFTMDASGHGTYTELVEKQAGSSDFLLGVGDYLTVYVDASQLHAKSPQTGQDTLITTDDQFAALIKNLEPVINHQKLLTDTHVTFHF